MKKLGKVLCLSSALLLSGAAQAGWDANWLLGVSGAWGERSGNLNLTFEDPLVTTLFSTDDVDDDGWMWGIFAGYQARCNGLLAGVELSVDWADQDDTHVFAFTNGATTFGSAVSYDQDAVVALSARFGYEITSFLLPYVRLGIETSRDELDVTAFDAAGFAVSLDGSRRIWRFLGGVGLEVPFTLFDGLSLRAEYNYHSRGRAVEAGGTATDGITFVSVDTKQHTNSVKASLVWNFPA